MKYSDFKIDQPVKTWISEDNTFDYGTIVSIGGEYIEIHWQAANEIIKHTRDQWASILPDQL